jgi:hypothetical protein
MNILFLGSTGVHQALLAACLHLDPVWTGIIKHSRILTITNWSPAVILYI